MSPASTAKPKVARVRLDQLLVERGLVETRSRAQGPATQTRQGYHLLHWNTSAYVYWVVSDLGLVELREFSQLLQEADSARP